jgi:hypothetical protein
MFINVSLKAVYRVQIMLGRAGSSHHAMGHVAARLV